jgi:hypothetical protein
MGFLFLAKARLWQNARFRKNPLFLAKMAIVKIYVAPDRASYVRNPQISLYQALTNRENLRLRRNVNLAITPQRHLIAAGEYAEAG